MVVRDVEIERRLKGLEEIIHRFYRTVTNYSDCLDSLEGTIAEASDSGDMSQETAKYYIERVKDIIRYMPGPLDLEKFLDKYSSPVEEKDTSEEETVIKNLAELKELVTSVENDLAQIDNIDECLCPNNDKDITDYLTPEQWNERQQIMNNLEWHICMEFPWLIKEEELKRHNIK